MDILQASTTLDTLDCWRDDYDQPLYNQEKMNLPPSIESLSSHDLFSLLQCPVCHNLLSRPVTVPCGRSVCSHCLPDSHERPLVSYPDNPSRRSAISCPFSECGLEHCCADINRDFVLQSIIDGVLLAPHRNDDDIQKTAYFSQDRQLQDPFSEPSSSQESEAEAKPLIYSPHILSGDALSERLAPELSCLVCHTIFTSPITTGCGHTFCRQCLLQTTLSHPSCPICRHALGPVLSLSSQNTNRIISSLLQFAGGALSAPCSEPEPEDDSLLTDVPTFVCTLSFPSVPTYLHIFEPRYRLMLAQVLQQSPPMFAMVGYNQSVSDSEKPSSLAEFGCVDTGTMLEVISVQMTRDGRSVVELAGRYRFKIDKAGYHADGYVLTDVRRLDDISVPDEEAAEVADRTEFAARPREARQFWSSSYVTPDNVALLPLQPSPDEIPGLPMRPSISPVDDFKNISSLSTLELFDRCTAFITQMQSRSAPWLRRNVIVSVGPMPQDPAHFTWWFASVMPVSEAEKYRLLKTLSVRERLKICLEWIIKARQQVSGYGRFGGNSVTGDMCVAM